MMLLGVHDFVCFFFKQMTAYEMRISDWSSDVCSSDLSGGASDGALLAGVVGAGGAWRVHQQRQQRERGRDGRASTLEGRHQLAAQVQCAGRLPARQRRDRKGTFQHRLSGPAENLTHALDRKSTRLNSSH